MKCPLCQNNLKLKVDPEYFECFTCGALVKDMQFLPTPSEEKSRYLEHNNDVSDLRYQDFTSPITNYVLHHFTPEDKGLDFGSGTGPVISEMLFRKKYDISQYDPFFANDPGLLEQRYDYILACEVVEHFHNPKKEFENFRKMLKPGGSLVLMTLLYHDEIPFKNWYYRKDPTHVFIYRKETMEFIRENIGFKDLRVQKRLVVLSTNGLD